MNNPSEREDEDTYNPPAFPRSFSEDTYLKGVDYLAQDGMTLRDYFAAKALQGICSSKPGTLMTYTRIAAEAYHLANAMLKARNSVWHNATPKEREA